VCVCLVVGEDHADDQTVQPGVSVSRDVWERFRKNVKQRRGRINGVLSVELENAIEAYLDGAEGGDVTDELRRLREDVEDIHDEVLGEGATPPASDGGLEKRKNSQGSGKDTPSDPDDESDDQDDRSIVEKRTDQALAELVVGNGNAFALGDLDDAIETGAGVSSRRSKRQYRKRVFERLGGKDNLENRKTRDRPLESKIWFLDPSEASVANAIHLIEDKRLSFDAAVRKEDADPEVLRARARERLDRAVESGEIDRRDKRLVEEAGFDVPDDVELAE